MQITALIRNFFKRILHCCKLGPISTFSLRIPKILHWIFGLGFLVSVVVRGTGENCSCKNNSDIVAMDWLSQSLWSCPVNELDTCTWNIPHFQVSPRKSIWRMLKHYETKFLNKTWGFLLGLPFCPTHSSFHLCAAMPKNWPQASNQVVNWVVFTFWFYPNFQIHDVIWKQQALTCLSYAALSAPLRYLSTQARCGGFQWKITNTVSLNMKTV